MRSSTNKRIITLCLAAPLVGLLAACSKSKQPTEAAQRAEQTSGSAVRASTMTATVEEVDREQRTVTLREPNGEVFTVNVSESAPLESIEPQDTVNVAYQGILTFELKEPGSAPKGEQSMSAKQLPSGVEYVHRADTTVLILSVEATGRSVTFRDGNGQVRTIEVVDPMNREKVARLRPGDSVNVGFTERLDIQLER